MILSFSQVCLDCNVQSQNSPSLPPKKYSHPSKSPQFEDQGTVIDSINGLTSPYLHATYHSCFQAENFTYKYLPSQRHKAHNSLNPRTPLCHKKKRQKSRGRSHKPGLDMRLMRERGPSNFQLSSSKDLTSLLRAAIRSDFSTATNILGKQINEYLTTFYINKQQSGFLVVFSIKGKNAYEPVWKSLDIYPKSLISMAKLEKLFISILTHIYNLSCSRWAKIIEARHTFPGGAAGGWGKGRRENSLIPALIYNQKGSTGSRIKSNVTIH